MRAFRHQALTWDQLGQLLWAAQGTTGTDAKRAAPSAGALYPLELYVVAGHVEWITAGVYRYLPRTHEAVLIAPGHQRVMLVDAVQGQEWIATAPAIVCIAAAVERTTEKYGNRGRGYVYMEAGHAAENLMLQAVALGLAATMVGAFNDDAVKQLLHLRANETPLCLIPVGTP
jgi:SagB-type dehydrogenase family enzyme